MEAKSTDRKTLQLTENEQLLGELVYENLFFLKADIKLANGDFYQLKQVDFFGTSVTVTKNETAIADLKMNWNSLGLKTKYYNTDLHKGCFALPNYVKELLNNV